MTIVSASMIPACLVFASLSLLAGCDDKAGGAASASAAKSGAPATSGAPAAGGKTASCNVIKAESLCREYGSKNVEAAGEDFLKKTCDGLKGDFKMEACPKDKRVGSCATPEGTKVFYSEGPLPLDAAAAEKSCKEGVPAGDWKAGG